MKCPIDPLQPHQQWLPAAPIVISINGQFSKAPGWEYWLLLPADPRYLVSHSPETLVHQAWSPSPERHRRDTGIAAKGIGANRRHRDTIDGRRDYNIGLTAVIFCHRHRRFRPGRLKRGLTVTVQLS